MSPNIEDNESPAPDNHPNHADGLNIEEIAFPMLSPILDNHPNHADMSKNDVMPSYNQFNSPNIFSYIQLAASPIFLKGHKRVSLIQLLTLFMATTNPLKTLPKEFDIDLYKKPPKL